MLSRLPNWKRKGGGSQQRTCLGVAATRGFSEAASFHCQAGHVRYAVCNALLDPRTCRGKRERQMGLIGTIVIGLIVGVVAKLLLPGRDPGGFLMTILLGIAGALVATYLGQAMNLYAVGESAGFVGAVVGAVILLLIYRLAFRRAGGSLP